MSNPRLKETLLVMFNNGEPQHLWKIMALRPEQLAPWRSCCTRPRSAWRPWRTPRSAVTRSSSEPPSEGGPVHALSRAGWHKVIHYIRHAEGANLSPQPQFPRGAAMKAFDALHAKFQRSEFLPDPL